MSNNFPPSLGASAQNLGAAAGALLVLCCAVWGLNQVGVKLAHAGIAPIMQAGLRSVGSGLLLMLWMAWRGHRLLPRDGTATVGIFVGLLFAAEFVALYTGLSLTSASRGVVLLYCAPFVVAIGSHLLVADDKLNRNKIIGLCAAFAGIVLAFADKLTAPQPGQLLGDVLCLVGGVLWGGTTVAIKATSLRNAAAENTLFYQLAVSALVLPLASLLVGEPGLATTTARVSGQAAWIVAGALAFQIVLVAFATYLVWFWLIRHYAASVLSAFTFLTPVFGVFFGWLVLGEPISPSLVGAVVLIGSGIYVVNRG